ncbi:MAG: Hsp20/alpha crystallin family protein [Polyangiaceae bacterium]|nr:Hsp20/alpha crystallin family protein [Polyangiaceae bacterium]
MTDNQSRTRQTAAPRVDVYENEREILLVADLPGVSKDALTIQAEGDTLTLEARRSDPATGTALFRESPPRDFSRSFGISPRIDRDRIEAKLEGGVLYLHLPKHPALTPRKIPVRVG